MKICYLGCDFAGNCHFFLAIFKNYKTATNQTFACFEINTFAALN